MAGNPDEVTLADRWSAAYASELQARRARAPRPHEPRPASCIIGNLAAGCHRDGGAVVLTQGARGNVHSPCVDDDDFSHESWLD